MRFSYLRYILKTSYQQKGKHNKVRRHLQISEKILHHIGLSYISGFICKNFIIRYYNNT